jgi:hypothetical protein
MDYKAINLFLSLNFKEGLIMPIIYKIIIINLFLSGFFGILERWVL